MHCPYLNVCELYLNNHPRFYTGPKLPKTEPQFVPLFADCSTARLLLLALENFVTRLLIILTNLIVTVINCRYSYKFRVLETSNKHVFLINHGFANYS